MAWPLRLLAAKAARGGRSYTRGFPGRKISRSTYALALVVLLVSSLVLLLLLGLGIFSLPIHSDDAFFPRVRQNFVREVEGLGHRGPQWTEVISWQPRAFIYHNFLSKEECEYLIELAKPHMQKSTVVDSTTGKSKDSRVRTSTGTFLRRGQDNVIKTIEKRIADYTFIPADNVERKDCIQWILGATVKLLLCDLQVTGSNPENSLLQKKKKGKTAYNGSFPGTPHRSFVHWAALSDNVGRKMGL